MHFLFIPNPLDTGIMDYDLQLNKTSHTTARLHQVRRAMLSTPAIFLRERLDKRFKMIGFLLGFF